MTELDRMILAARQIGEVVGEDLLQRIYMMDDGVYLDTKWRDTPIYDQDALDLLTARVWRAVRKACIAFNWQEDTDTGEHIAVWYAANGDAFMANDLPSAVAAIHKHWQENRNG